MKSLRSIKENWKILLLCILLVTLYAWSKHQPQTEYTRNCDPIYSRTGESLNDCE